MSASYPSTIKSFTTRNTGDTITGAFFNDPQDEITAVETALLNGLSHALTTNGNIVFPATQLPSANANTLDDYEEGTWTPVIGGSGGTSGQTYGGQVGHYVKIGKQVHATFNVTLTAKGTITTDVQIQGLPFTIENIVSYTPSLVISFWGTLGVAWVTLGGFGNANTTTATVWGTKVAAVSSSVLATADIANATQLVGCITYRASA